jgi:hypothetical protein
LIQPRIAESVFRLTERHKLKKQRLLKTASNKAAGSGTTGAYGGEGM